MYLNCKLNIGQSNTEKHIDYGLFLQVSSFPLWKGVWGQVLKNFPHLSELAYTHTAALSAFMFIQIFASGTSQQNYSVRKFNLWGVTSNRRSFCLCDGRVCQRAGPYRLIGIISKHRGMMGKPQSKCPHSIPSLPIIIIT